MANDFTELQGVYFNAAHVVSRELCGFIAAANTDFDDKGAALGEAVDVPRIGSVATSDYNPAMTTAAGDDTEPSTDSLTITKSKKAHWNATHEQRQSMINAGTWAEFQRQKAMEAMRALCNEIEVDLATEAYRNASRVIGAAGTTPFASNLDLVASLKAQLDLNGAPSGRALVIDSLAGANVRNRITTGFLQGADAKENVISGELLNLHGISIGESAGVVSHTKGDGASYAVDLVAGYGIGDREIHIDTGTGALLAGDVITFADDTNKYVVNTGFAGDGDGDIVLGRPGLRQALANDKAITIGNSYTANVAFARSALAAAVRPPIIEANANMRCALVGDEKTGLTFLICEVIGDGMTTYRVHVAWGVKAIQSEHIVGLMG